MVRGIPNISVNNDTRKASVIPREVQLCLLKGLTNATMKRLSRVTDRITAGQSPNPLPERPIGVRKKVTNRLNNARDTTTVQFLIDFISFTFREVSFASL